MVKAALPIEVDPEIMSGAPVFSGTRVPVETLFYYLMHGQSIEDFLTCFPSVNRQDVLLVLGFCQHEVVAESLA